MSAVRLIPQDLLDLYEIHEWRHAASILAADFPMEFEELCGALRQFRISIAQIKTAGGNESAIPKTLSSILRPLGWTESKLTAKFVVDGVEHSPETHKVDYVKNRVALDLEWNSKDQTFDRDLYAFRSFFEFDRISVGVLVTRGNDLDRLFAGLGEYVDKYGVQRQYKAKYGASTTHLGKLLPRLKANRGGGCPVLVFGITRKIIVE